MSEIARYNWNYDFQFNFTQGNESEKTAHLLLKSYLNGEEYNRRFHFFDIFRKIQRRKEDSMLILC